MRSIVRFCAAVVLAVAGVVALAVPAGAVPCWPCLPPPTCSCSTTTTTTTVPSTTTSTTAPVPTTITTTPPPTVPTPTVVVTVPDIPDAVQPVEHDHDVVNDVTVRSAEAPVAVRVVPLYTG